MIGGGRKKSGIDFRGRAEKLIIHLDVNQCA